MEGHNFLKTSLSRFRGHLSLSAFNSYLFWKSQFKPPTIWWTAVHDHRCNLCRGHVSGANGWTVLFLFTLEFLNAFVFSKLSLHNQTNNVYCNTKNIHINLTTFFSLTWNRCEHGTVMAHVLRNAPFGDISRFRIHISWGEQMKMLSRCEMNYLDTRAVRTLLILFSKSIGEF